MNVIKLIIEQINVCVGSNSFRNDSNHCQFVRVTSINYILITFHLKACTYCIVLSPRAHPLWYSLNQRVIYLPLSTAAFASTRPRVCAHFLNDKWPIFAREDLAAPQFLKGKRVSGVISNLKNYSD